MILSVLLPNALSSFLHGIAYKDLHELFPLINQIAMKFKETSLDVMIETVPALFQATFAIMAQSDVDEERKLINRDFLGFIHQLCKSNLAQVLMSQPGHLAEIIDKLKCGALGKDPVAAKVGFLSFTTMFQFV